PNEQAYGLGTTAAESEWKLKQIAAGHQDFFAALGWFVAQGNHVALIRGNHDVELHWRQVRERFAVEAMRAHTRQYLREDGDPPKGLDAYHQRIHFYPWVYYEAGRIYVEHGCQYDVVNHFRDVLNPVLPDDPERIELPWGSLFVRYLFNRVEDIHPFADNVKPLTRYLSWAFRTNPIKALQVLLGRGWTFLKAFWMTGRKAAARHSNQGAGSSARESVTLPKGIVEEIQALARRRVGSWWQRWLEAFLRGLVSLLTLAIAAAFLGLTGVTLFLGSGPRWMSGVYAAATIFAVILRRGLTQIFARASERRDLLDAAFELERILEPAQSVRIIAMGHNHRPSVERLDDTWYVNTGAWVPLYERDGPVEGREALTFLRVGQAEKGAPELLRWDDAGGAPTPMVQRDDLLDRQS
ncbi:MAG: hypothetical protein PVH50_06295, partial [Anaerolineae bacterium]